ncbi:hypothetical protein MUJ63_05670 [Lachnospiraceae bacterium NSJ-143]|nr:hypothetical protein [Lachnospiraceae bacterium NSJ-143]
MFYKTLILTMFLSCMAFGTGISMDSERIKHLTVFRLLLFWGIVISAKAGELIAVNIIAQYPAEIIKCAAAVVTLFLGIGTIIRGLSKKAAVFETAFNMQKVFPVFYIALNTLLIISAFAACGIAIKHAPIITAVSEIIFISLGMATRKNIINIYSYNYNTWYCLSGSLTIFMVILYFI